MCVTEKTTDPLLHTAALQFLSTVLTEETKRQSFEDTTSNSKRVPSLCDIVKSPSADQLWELLLEVCRTCLLRFSN